MQLFHHQLLDGELADDAFLLSPFGHHVGHVEMNPELILVLQSCDRASSLDSQQTTGPRNHHITEGDGVVTTLHPNAKIKGERKVTEYGGKRPRDVAQYCMSLNGRCAIGQRGAVLLVWQLHESTVELQLRILLPDHHIGKMQDFVTIGNTTV